MVYKNNKQNIECYKCHKNDAMQMNAKIKIIQEQQMQIFKTTTTIITIIMVILIIKIQTIPVIAQLEM